MGQAKRDSKRRWRIWKHGSLISLVCLLCLYPGKPASSKISSSKGAYSQKNKRSQAYLKKNSKTKKQIAGLTKKRNSSNKINQRNNFRKSNLKKKRGWYISYMKTNSLQNKMKLKRGDIVSSVKQQAVYSEKQFYKAVSSALKKNKKISLTVIRNKKKFLISYKVVPFKNKKRFLISKIQKLSTLTNHRKIASVQEVNKSKNSSVKLKDKNKNVKTETPNKKQKKSKNSSVKLKDKSKNVKIETLNKKQKKSKKTIVPKKYRTHLQKAYILTLNSFVYKKPDFDSPQLYPLTVGQKILISKKIFRPPHNFGSFYKVFLFREKKVVGYVSEAEVVTEFVKENNKYTANPAYELAKKQMAEDKVLDINLIDKVQKKKQTTKQTTPDSKDNKKSYIGFSFGLSAHDFYSLDYRNTFLGLKLSGYNLLISYLNMDLNLTVSPYKRFYFDILTAFPVLRAPSYHIFAMGGAHLIANTERKDPVDYGVTGALSLIIPINRSFIMRMDAKTGYDIRVRLPRYDFLSSLQIAF